MKLLLDECLPVDIRHEITGHDVFTVSYMGWAGVRNGRLLARAAADGFVALVTTDGSIEHQQNLTTLPLAVVVLEAASNDLEDLKPFVSPLINSLQLLKMRSVTNIARPP